MVGMKLSETMQQSGGLVSWSFNPWEWLRGLLGSRNNWRVRERQQLWGLFLCQAATPEQPGLLTVIWIQRMRIKGIEASGLLLLGRSLQHKHCFERWVFACWDFHPASLEAVYGSLAVLLSYSAAWSVCLTLLVFFSFRCSRIFSCSWRTSSLRMTSLIASM